MLFRSFVNRALGLVRQLQKEGYGARYFATDLTSPDFVKLAAAYGLKGVRVTASEQVEPTLRRALRAKGPVLVEVAIPKEACV